MLLPETETAMLIAMAIKGTPDITQAELAQIEDWADDAIVRNSVLSAVLEGAVFPLVKDGEVMFRNNPDHPVVKEIQELFGSGPRMN